MPWIYNSCLVDILLSGTILQGHKIVHECLLLLWSVMTPTKYFPPPTESHTPSRKAPKVRKKERVGSMSGARGTSCQRHCASICNIHLIVYSFSLTRVAWLWAVVAMLDRTALYKIWHEYSIKYQDKCVCAVTHIHRIQRMCSMKGYKPSVRPLADMRTL